MGVYGPSAHFVVGSNNIIAEPMGLLHPALALLA